MASRNADRSGGKGLSSEDEEIKKVSWYKKIENWWIVVGFIIAGVAISLPFAIMCLAGLGFKMSSFQDLGVVGDFFGGTTVGLLSFASIILVTAAMIMQKQELEIQRNEVTKTREEYEITNKTMKRQQFESTFFNMINLHQTILSNLKRNEIVGRELIAVLFAEFKEKAIIDYREFKFLKYLSDKEISQIFNRIYPIVEKEKLNEELDKIFKQGDLNTVQYVHLQESIEDGEEDLLEYYPSLLKILEKHPDIVSQIQGIEISLRHEIMKFPQHYFLNSDVYKLNDKYVIEDILKWEKIKKNSYETFYKKYEYIFGHYYRNLYRIVKYVNESDLLDDLAKKEFRGILRAQLSSYEIMMLFYNVMYSEKGKKFKEQLLEKNFFDDHLLLEELVWNDEVKYIEEIK